MKWAHQIGWKQRELRAHAVKESSSITHANWMGGHTSKTPMLNGTNYTSIAQLAGKPIKIG
jgi:hypothetical protein